MPKPIRLVTIDGHNAMDDTADAAKVITVNAAGTTIASQTPIFSVATATTGAIALATNPAGIFRLLSVTLHLSAAPTSSESLTVTLDAGDGGSQDTLLFTQDLLVGSITDLAIPFGEGYEFEADDDIDIAYTNDENNTYGVRLAYQLL